MKNITNVSTLLRVILGLFVSLIVSSCVGETGAYNKESILIIGQINTPETVQTFEDLSDRLSRKLKGKYLEVAIAEGTQVNVFYAKETRRADLPSILEDIDPNDDTAKLETIPSSEDSLITMIQRFCDRVYHLGESERLTTFIVTEGTNDPKIIGQIRYLVEKLAKSPNASKSRLYIIGLKQGNRLPLTKSVRPIADFVEFSSDNPREWAKIVQRIK